MPSNFASTISYAALLQTALLFSLLFTPARAGDTPWPQWRGPERNDQSSETNLLQSWPEGGPKLLWTFDDCGLGYSGPAVVKDRMYLLGSRDKQEMLLCLDAKLGNEIWAVPVGDEYKNGYGNGPRSTPTVEGEFIYAASGKGDLICCRSEDGSQVWSKSMKEFGGKIPTWGYSESPLIHGEKILYTPGGEKGAIVALDKATGKLLWQTEELTDEAHYSSIVFKKHGGKTMGVQLLVSELVGFDVETGEVLWRVQWPGRTAVVPTPVFWKDCVYVTSGYGSGCMLVRIAEDFSTETVYESKLMSNHHGGVILHGDYIFGHSNGKGWVCQTIKDGKRKWRERASLGKGAISYADKRFYCLSEDSGELVLITASDEGWEEHGRFKMEPQSEQRSSRGRIWVHPVIADGLLYLRDQEFVHCYDVRAH